MSPTFSDLEEGPYWLRTINNRMAAMRTTFSQMEVEMSFLHTFDHKPLMNDEWLHKHRRTRFTSPEIDAIASSPTLSEGAAYDLYVNSFQGANIWLRNEPEHPCWYTTVPLPHGSKIRTLWLAYLKQGPPSYGYEPVVSSRPLSESSTRSSACAGFPSTAWGAFPWSHLRYDPDEAEIPIAVDTRGRIFFPRSPAPRLPMTTPHSPSELEKWGAGFANLKALLLEGVNLAFHTAPYPGQERSKFIPMNLDYSLPADRETSDDPLHQDVLRNSRCAEDQSLQNSHTRYPLPPAGTTPVKLDATHTVPKLKMPHPRDLVYRPRAPYVPTRCTKAVPLGRVDEDVSSVVPDSSIRLKRHRSEDADVCTTVRLGPPPPRRSDRIAHFGQSLLDNLAAGSAADQPALDPSISDEPSSDNQSRGLRATGGDGHFGPASAKRRKVRCE